MRLDLDKGNIVEHHLVLLHRPFDEHLSGDVLGRDVDPLGPRLVQNVWEEAHLEFETENVYFGDVFLVAFQYYLFHK